MRTVPLLLLLLVIVAACVGLVVSTVRPTRPRESFQLDFEGGERSYHVWGPLDRSRPRPVVFAFHGTFGDPIRFVTRAKLTRWAREHDAYVVAPAAQRGMWRVDPSNGETESPDVRFFDLLLADVASRWRIDEGRVYVVGMSNGGAFAHRLAVARPRSVAAAVAYAGTLGRSSETSDPTSPILFVVGTEDRQASVEVAEDWAARTRAVGGVAAVRVLPGVGHAWEPGVNESLWQFLRRPSVE